jgi:hypothetical protein
MTTGLKLLDTLQAHGYGRSEALGSLLNHMAGADIIMGRWTQARLHLEMAYDIHYRRESIGRQLRSMSLWAMMNRLQGHIDKSGALYTRLQQTAMEQAALRYIANASIGYTENLVLSGRYAEALHEIGEQTKRQPVETDVSITVRTKAAMGMSHWGQGQKDVGIRLALQGLNLINSTVVITRNYFEALSSVVAVLCLWLLDRRDRSDADNGTGETNDAGTNGDNDASVSRSDNNGTPNSSVNLSALGGHGPSHSLVASIGMFTQLCGTMIVARPRLLVWRGVSLLARQAKGTRPSADCESQWREALELARSHEMVYEQALSLYWLSRCGIDPPTGCAAIFSLCLGGGEAYRKSVAERMEYRRNANTLLRSHGLSLAALDPALASDTQTLQKGSGIAAIMPPHDARLRRRSLSVAGLFSQRPKPGEEEDIKTEEGEGKTSPMPGSPGTPVPVQPATPMLAPSVGGGGSGIGSSLAAPSAMGAGGSTNFKAIVASSPSAIPHHPPSTGPSPTPGTPNGQHGIARDPGSPATPMTGPSSPAQPVGKYQLPAKKSTTVVTVPVNPFTFGSANNTQVSPSQTSKTLPPPTQIVVSGAGAPTLPASASSVASGHPAMVVTELHDGLDSGRDSVIRQTGGTLRRTGHNASMSMDDTQVREVMRAAGGGVHGNDISHADGIMYSPVPVESEFSSRLHQRRRQAFRLPAEQRMDTLDSLLGESPSTRPTVGTTPPRPVIGTATASGINTAVGLASSSTAMFASSRAIGAGQLVGATTATTTGGAIPPTENDSPTGNNSGSGSGNKNNGGSSGVGSPAGISSGRGGGGGGSQRDRGALRVRRMSFDEVTRNSLGQARGQAAAAAAKEATSSPELERRRLVNHNQSSPIHGPMSPPTTSNGGGRLVASSSSSSGAVVPSTHVPTTLSLGPSNGIDSGRTHRSTERSLRGPNGGRSDSVSSHSIPSLGRQGSNVKLRISIHSPNHKGSPQAEHQTIGNNNNGLTNSQPIDEAEVIEDGAMTEREALFTIEDTPPTRHASRIRGTSPVFGGPDGNHRASAAVMAYGHTTTSSNGKDIVVVTTPQRPALRRLTSIDVVTVEKPRPIILSAAAQAVADMDAAAQAALDRFIDLLPKQVLYYFLCSAFKPHNGIRPSPHNSRHTTLVAAAPNGTVINLPMSPNGMIGRPNLLARPDHTLAVIERSLLLSSVTHRPLEGAILAIHFRLVDANADPTTTFTSINTLLGFLLVQALRHDGRLVLINSSSLVLLWERTAQTPLLAVAKAAESCAFAMGVAINQYLNTLRRVEDLTWRSPFFIRYVISAGALVALQSPGVQASARICTIFGSPLNDALVHTGPLRTPGESTTTTPLPTAHGPGPHGQLKGKHTSTAAAAALLNLPTVPSSPNIPISSLVASPPQTPLSPNHRPPPVNTLGDGSRPTPGNGASNATGVSHNGNNNNVGSPDSPDSPSNANASGGGRAIRGNIEYCGISAALVDQSSKRAESSVRRLSLRLRLRSAVAGLTAMNKIKGGWAKYGKQQPGGGLLALMRAARMHARAEDAKNAALMSPPASPPVAATSLSSSPPSAMNTSIVLTPYVPSLVSTPLTINTLNDPSQSAPSSPQPPMALAISVHPPDAVAVIEAEQAAAAAAAAVASAATAATGSLLSNALALPTGANMPLSPLSAVNGMSFTTSVVRGSMRNTAVLARLAQYMSSLGLIREALRLYMPQLHTSELLHGTESTQTCVLIRCRFVTEVNQPSMNGASLPVLEFEPVIHALRSVVGLFPGTHAMLFPHGDSIHATLVHAQAHKMLRLTLWILTAAQVIPPPPKQTMCSFG